MEADYFELSTKHVHLVVMQGPHALHVLKMSASPQQTCSIGCVLAAGMMWVSDGQ